MAEGELGATASVSCGDDLEQGGGVGQTNRGGALADGGAAPIAVGAQRDGPIADDPQALAAGAVMGRCA
ncbi:MAG: hypothetical protein ACRDPG_04895 [Nocardioidaceae bacterium]